MPARHLFGGSFVTSLLNFAGRSFYFIIVQLFKDILLSFYLLVRHLFGGLKMLAN